jgi:hypothetical protein
MRTGVTLSDITRAADQLLANGERPTVEGIRNFLGTGSPANVNSLLKEYYQALPARLNLPAPIATAAAELYEKVRSTAMEEVDGQRVELERQATLDREQLAQERRAFDSEKTTLRSQVASLTNDVQRQQEVAPEYRALAHPRYKEVIEQRIQPGLSEDKLDEALLHVKRDIEDAVRKEARHVAALFATETFEQYQERFKEVAEKANEIGKAQLAAYIAHRRTILDLVNNSLKKKRSDDKYPLERVLHKMIFPMGMTSKDIFFEQQNLWVIDERLCYHTLLTSDKKLNSVAGLEDTSGKEPDIFTLFYDTPIGVAEPDNLPGGGVVIIEFKRPGRDDYNKDPADQVIQRFREIAEGGVTDVEGRQINPTGLRYTGYLIADLTPSLHRQVFGRYHKTADNEGYFSPLATGNGYIEILSYDKLVRDAARRNRILFDKLGLHKN